MVEVKSWATPSGRQASSGANKVVADVLRTAPPDPKDGLPQWAIVEEHQIPDDATEASDIRAKASNRASLVKQGRLAPFKPKGAFNAVSRSEPESEGSAVRVVRVYARYLGEENEKELRAAEEAVPATA